MALPWEASFLRFLSLPHVPPTLTLCGVSLTGCCSVALKEIEFQLRFVFSSGDWALLDFVANAPLARGCNVPCNITSDRGLQGGDTGLLSSLLWRCPN